jgi:hypothetical protein
MDKGNHLLLAAAIAPPGQPWAGDLRAFFSVPPTSTVGTVPDAAAEREREMIGRLYDTAQQSKSGDTASALYIEGLAKSANGDSPGVPLLATRKLLGWGPLKPWPAGDLSRAMGHQDQANFWYESAANAGQAVGMFNTAVAASQKGRPAGGVAVVPACSRGRQ